MTVYLINITQGQYSLMDGAQLVRLGFLDLSHDYHFLDVWS